MDKAKIEKLRPVIGGVIITTLLLWWLLPKIFHDNSKITASGTVEVKEADIASRTGGRLISTAVKEGSMVKAGDPLFSLDGRSLESAKQAAQSAYRTARRNFERTSELVGSGSVSQAEHERMEMQYYAAKAAYEQASVMLEEANLTAPWDGVITGIHAEVGELVSPNTPVMTLADLREAKVTIYVPLVDMEKLKTGMEAQVKLDAFNDKVFIGTITNIADKAEFTPKNVQTKDERVKQVFAVEISVPNAEMILKPGIPADVTIKTISSETK